MGIASRGGWALVVLAVLVSPMLLSACTQTSGSSVVPPQVSPVESPSPAAMQTTAASPPATSPPGMAPSCRNETCMVRTYFDTLYPMQKEDEYSILYDTKEVPWLENRVPGAQLVQAYARFQMPEVPATFIFFRGQAYAMPGEFDEFIREADVMVRNRSDALGIADLYVKAWEPGGSWGIAPAIIASSPGDIPQRRSALPPGIATRISPPEITRTGDEWTIGLFTWSMVGGTVREWNLTFARNGTVLDSRNEPMGNLLGDYLATSKG